MINAAATWFGKSYFLRNDGQYEMILFLDWEAVPYDAVQNALEDMRERGYRIAIVGDEEKSSFVKRAAEQIGADFHGCYESKNGYSALGVFQKILQEGDTNGDESLVISSKGECLTASVILGAHFVWVIDLI